MYLQARCAESQLSALGLCRSVEYPFVEGKGDCHEGGSLHSLKRFIEKIRPKEKAKKKKGWKKAGVPPQAAPPLLRPLAQRDDLCYHHVVYPGRYSCGSVPAVFTCGEKAYIAKQKKRHG
jgi:hypothetical protein